MVAMRLLLKALTDVPMAQWKEFAEEHVLRIEASRPVIEEMVQSHQQEQRDIDDIMSVEPIRRPDDQLSVNSL